MKVLTVRDFYFLLPKDFKGSLADALNLVADHLNSRKQPLAVSPRTFDDPWAHFHDVVKRGGKMRGDAGVSNKHSNESKWVEQPLKKTRYMEVG